MKIVFVVTVNLTKRIREESLAPLGKGDRSGERSRRSSREQSTRLRWMRCIIRTLLHVFKYRDCLSQSLYSY